MKSKEGFVCREFYCLEEPKFGGGDLIYGGCCSKKHQQEVENMIRIAKEGFGENLKELAGNVDVFEIQELIEYYKTI